MQTLIRHVDDSACRFRYLFKQTRGPPTREPAEPALQVEQHHEEESSIRRESRRHEEGCVSANDHVEPETASGCQNGDVEEESLEVEGCATHYGRGRGRLAAAGCGHGHPAVFRPHQSARSGQEHAWPTLCVKIIHAQTRGLTSTEMRSRPMRTPCISWYASSASRESSYSTKANLPRLDKARAAASYGRPRPPLGAGMSQRTNRP